ncbi:MAG: hypothetical protein LBQ66_04815 [Planctomycetaceae bacterium]|jgi:predicted dienelactone hydrolase|nr:hypothetical protein [Planctomycetaceae bacterium]
MIVRFVIIIFVAVYLINIPFGLSCCAFDRYPIMTGQSVWRDTKRHRDIPVKIFFPLQSEQSKTPKHTGEQSDSSHSKDTFPVILFSHGLGGTYDRCSYLSTVWSSLGFVVVSVQHPGSDEHIWRGKLRVVKELRDSYEQNWNCRTRAEDLRFVLDVLVRLNDAGKLGRIRPDLSNVGVSGYDIGSLGPLLLAGQMPPDRGRSLRDSRVQAVVAMSPPVRNPGLNNARVYADIRIPALFITGTRDDGIIGITKAHQRRIPFDYMTNGDKFLMTFLNGDHQVYAGPLFSVSRLFRDDNIYQQTITKISSYFWLAYLKDNEKAKKILNSTNIKHMLGELAKFEKKTIPNKQNKPEELPEEIVPPKKIK